MIAQMPDLVVTDRKRWPILAIEVQNLKEFDRGYAVNFRKEFVPELALASRVRCLIIASQDTAYVWAHNDRDPADAAPSFEFSTRPIVEHYLAQSKRHEFTGMANESMPTLCGSICDSGSKILSGQFLRTKGHFYPPNSLRYSRSSRVELCRRNPSVRDDLYRRPNFILQSAWVQEDVPAVTEIYVRVRGRQLKLKCPAVAIGEVVAQVANRNARRGDFRDLLMGHRVMDDLSRSGLHLDAVRKVRDIADYLKDMRSDEEARVDAELQRFFDAGGEVLPLLPHCLSTASQLRGNPDNRMRLADSYVAATILVDLYSIRKLHPNQK